MSEFDFDEWAELYKRDPAEFEARRKAVLAIELAKGGAEAAPAREMLRRLDQRVEGLDDTERARTAFVWMAASLGQLSSRMGELGESVTHLRQQMDRAAMLQAGGAQQAPRKAA